MLLGLVGSVSWICLLLFSTASCFPATKGGAGYASAPVGTGSQSFSVQPQPGTSGGSVYKGPSLPHGSENTAATYDSGLSFGPVEVPLPYANTAESYNMDGPVPYGASGPGLSYGNTESYNMDGPVPYGASGPGLPADSFFDPSAWMPSRPFPDFDVWKSADAAPQSMTDTSPLPPSSYIIQSRMGYQRMRETLSHSKYSPENPEPPMLAFRADKAPSSYTPAVGGAKGGYKGH